MYGIFFDISGSFEWCKNIVSWTLDLDLAYLGVGRVEECGMKGVISQYMNFCQ